ncbi:uncharacterized protein LOC126879210 [Diabrotica virgifera virgifera]|uniref:HTH CENPB-type domain-containing protein n=1 Tax=Diabrotica virgifera virgifera TaxID=50390 RepID=A0ABM5JJV5_DIAVI|nr:uncharacterized protein LOC126879210 [Diabrotica virgifera virgifera]
MPKTKKIGTRQFFSYSEDDLKKAIEAVTQNGISRKAAARQFNVPRTTLIRKLYSPATTPRKMGPATELSEAEENVFENWVLAMARKGFPIHRQNLMLSVKKFLEETGRETKYLLNKTPGRSWFQGFLKRHPKIKERYPEAVSKARAAVTQDRIEAWFDEIQLFLEEDRYDEILLDPTRVFNADEAGFCLCPKSEKVLGPVGYKEDFYIRVSSEKEQITVMATFSADGKHVPPMLIFPYKRIPEAIAKSVPENWGLGRSDSGWMTSQVFYEYISNHFLPYLKSNNIQRPVILFVDGHRSHSTKHVSQLCDDNGIILVSLFPNTTHIMQPADVSVFKPLKAGWSAEVRNWKFQNFPKDVTRSTFGTILESVFSKYASEETIKNGFRRSGLYPFNKNNVDYTKCIPNRIVAAQISDKETPKNALDVLENKIEKKYLTEFIQTYSKRETWSEDISYSKLYSVWAEIKMDCENENPQQKEIHPKNISITSPVAGPSRRQWETPPQKLEYENPQQKEIHPKNIGITSPVAGPSRRQWETPPQKNIRYYEEKESEGFKIPTPFKKCLVFPQTPDGTLKTPKHKRKIFPAVVSSAKYREFYENEVKKKNGPKITKRKQQKTNTVNEESSSNSDMDVTYLDEDLDLSENENIILKTNQHVIVKYMDTHYPGIVLKHDEFGADIRTMVSAGINSWKWPVKEDVLYYFIEDIVCNIKEPEVKNNRGHFSVPEMAKYNGVHY